jgi:hypothetical protein
MEENPRNSFLSLFASLSMCQLLNIADYWQKHRPLPSPKGTRYGSEVNKGTTACSKTHPGINAEWNLGCSLYVAYVSEYRVWVSSRVSTEFRRTEFRMFFLLPSIPYSVRNWLKFRRNSPEFRVV